MSWKATESRFVPVRAADDLLSVAVATPAEGQALAEHLRNAKDWLEVVPGIDSVVVRFDAATLNGEDAMRRLADALVEGISPPESVAPVLEIPVVYGGEHGPDLDALCERFGMTRDEFIALHTGREYTVDMVGFTPGFAFIGGLDERLRAPRRDSPRQRVAAGSVAVADERTGIYAIASPGGWNVIGRTSLSLFDPGAEHPFLLAAGRRVRFTAVEAEG